MLVVLIVTVATPLTLDATTPLPTKLSIFAVVTTVEPSSCTTTPGIPPAIVTLATLPILATATPDPTKFIILVETTLLPVLCTVILPLPPPPV